MTESQKILTVYCLAWFFVGQLSVFASHHIAQEIGGRALTLVAISQIFLAPGAILVGLCGQGLLNLTAWGNFWAALTCWSAGFLWLRLRAQRPSTPEQDRAFSRRAFLGGGIAAGAGLIVLAYGYQVERYELQLTRLTVPLSGLPPELDGLKVALMADWHCGPHNSQDYLKKAIDLCNSCSPDLILIPGDFISYNVQNAQFAAELLSMLRPKISDGLLVSWGNHDAWHGLTDRPEIITQTGARLLRQSRLQLTSRRNWEQSPTGNGLWIVGLDDLWTGNPDLAKGLQGIPEGQTSLVLCHNPDVAELQPNGRVGLMLSGHTHGGQIRLPVLGPPVVPSNYGQKYAQGWVQGPGYPVFVTQGVGVGGVPVRLGVPPQVAILELKSG